MKKNLENFNDHCLQLNKNKFKKRKLLVICVDIGRKDLSKILLIISTLFTVQVHIKHTYSLLLQ